QLAADRASVDQAIAAVEAIRLEAEARFAAQRAEVEARAAEAERLAASTAEREAALAHQVERLKDVGQALAAERKGMSDARAQWAADRAAAEAEVHRIREE